jgi:hypothetical protein
MLVLAAVAAAAAPSLWVQMTVITGGLAGLITLLVLCSKLKVVRWFLKTLIGDPLLKFVSHPAELAAEKMAEKLKESNASTAQALKQQDTKLQGQFDRIEAVTAETNHLVQYHLGPNDGTTPIHVRIQGLEDQVKVGVAGVVETNTIVKNRKI